MSFRCQNCPRSTVMSELTARASGWIVWSGNTLGGKHVNRTYCPACAGRNKQDNDGPSYDAECATCDARMSDGAWDEGPFTEEDADRWVRDHECEPDCRVIHPEEIEQQRRRAAELRTRMAVKS